MYWFTFGICVAAIASAIYAQQAVKSSNKALTYHHLTNLMEDYGQPEMRQVLTRICDDKRGNESQGHDIVEIYGNILKAKRGREYEDVAKRLRKISFFFQRMAVLYEAELLPGNILYRIWTKQGLILIREFIIPLEKKHYRILNDGENPPEHHYDHLEKLYKDSLDFPFLDPPDK